MFSLKVNQEIELQLLQLRDAEELYQLVDSNRRHLRQWLPWVDSMNSPLQYHSIIPMWLKQFADNNGFNLGIRYNKILVGSLGFHHIDWHNEQTSIGYYLAEQAQGRGIMTKSVQALLNYAFYDLGLNRIEIRCGTRNIASRSIPVRLGFTEEGLIRDGEKLNGFFHDLIVYGLLAREWRNLS
ncbi:RimJ/RimL family protein N-acetyltransferase [Bacillus canaveralius]|uniref:RimJ/RimL family protein N-acetyltransferase n=1 Tax=Bacillus canaveralius TaxID=1403243 RepID=A0A2N5GJF9_9BACI|nr:MULTISPECIES: GNAT family protein [Bacillus]PLR81206.1 RimJ/RimL family protein N-acetyltransferase [Bacillus canaveralius]PLR86627.1 RimJ/RimL family protein N-acetyltransferase [Bacillus sp. V33-4]PLS00653.1 RimJ/RimL family protein N-acetyltransferase [Bacillus canaveralius]RSK51532.1 N-acetyltransferase [Bacillus canaveralius]